MKIKALTLCPVLWSNMWHVITGSPATMRMKITSQSCFLPEWCFRHNANCASIEDCSIKTLWKQYRHTAGQPVRSVKGSFPWDWNIRKPADSHIRLMELLCLCQSCYQRYKGNLTAVAKKTRNARSYIYTSGQLYSPATLLKIKVPKWGFCRNATEDAFDVPQRTLEQDFF